MHQIDDPDYAIYKIEKEGGLTPLNKAANEFIVSNKPIFDKEAQLKILEEEGYDPLDN